MHERVSLQIKNKKIKFKEPSFQRFQDEIYYGKKSRKRQQIL